MANVSRLTSCAHCGRPLPAQRGRGRQRRYCGPTCRSAARRIRIEPNGTGRSYVNRNLTPAARKDILDIVANRTGGGTRLAAVAQARARARQADEELRATVELARSAGHTWQEIGEVLGTTRQAAFQRFGRPIDPRTGTPMAQAILPGATDRALALIGEVIAHRWTEARRDFGPEVAGRLDAGGLAEAWARVTGMVGRYERTGEPFARQLGDYTVVDVPLSFEAGELTGRISYDADAKVAGLFFLKPEAT